MKGKILGAVTRRSVPNLANKFSLSNFFQQGGGRTLDNVFSEIKYRLSMPEVARFYGLEMNRAGMACCPFHDDKSPSLKVYDDHFYYFGCGATGDQTGFVAKLFGLRQIDAAKKISEDFGLRLFDREFAAPIKMAVNPKYEMQKWLDGLAARRHTTMRRAI